MPGARFTGEWGNYHWFQASDLTLGSLVKTFPVLVRDRFVVVTSFDSGSLRLTPHELAAGWRQIDSLAVSPKTAPPQSLPLGGWDEWYVFADLPSARVPEVFVNFSGFSLRPDSGNEWQESAVGRFWAQIAEWRPESYLAEGDNLICVTRAEAVASELDGFFRVQQPAPRTRHGT